jgi:hypothetical protein
LKAWAIFIRPLTRMNTLLLTVGVRPRFALRAQCGQECPRSQKIQANVDLRNLGGVDIIFEANHE